MRNWMWIRCLNPSLRQAERRAVVNCYHCDAVLAPTELGRQDTCSKCGRDTRVCRNCRHYDTSASNYCREEQAPRQVEKEKGNFCEWFQPREGSVSGAGKAPTKDDLKAAAANLFKKK